MKKYLIPAVIVIVFMAWGDSPVFAKPDSCSLLTKEEVAQITVSSVKEVRLLESPRQNCSYTLEKGRVVVFLFTDAGAKGSFETGRKMQDIKTQDVAGVGDSAYWSPTAKVLNVLKKNTYATIQFILTREASLETAKKLAAHAVPRMP